MATFKKQELTEEFIKHFGITDVHETFSGGQKNVFIVTQENKKYALKIFINYGEREIRELGIYTEYGTHENIPKIAKQADYEKNKVVFEDYIDGDNLNDTATKYVGDAKKVKRVISDLIAILKPFWERNPSIIHRDIKPSNIIISPSGQANLIDFGIARILDEESITDTGAPQPGSWKFAAPEQYLGKKDLISYRTDFFSLAVLAYFLYHGQLPFGNTINQINDSYQKNPLVCPLASGCELNELFTSCFYVAPADRPRNAEKLLNLLG